MSLSIKIDTIKYQRNGSGGRGFYAVSFRHDGRAMVGMVIARDDEDPDRTISAEFCGVMDPANPTECWRGDNFEDELLAACLAASESGAAFA